MDIRIGKITLPAYATKVAAGVGLLIVLVLGWLGLDMNGFRHQPLAVADEQVLVVPAGSSLWAVARALEERGAISRPRYFVWWGRLQGYDQRIQAGEYILTPKLTPTRLLDNMVHGKVIQYTLTVVEGWTFKQLLAAIRQNEKLIQTLEGVTQEEIMSRLGKAGLHPEGMFLPDTYNFPAGTRDIDFLRRAFEAMDNLLTAEWPRRQVGLPYKTPYEALVMASIIEKETAVPEERNEIAGVFVRRLQKRMRLQTDPTVIYGMGERYDGNIRRRDLKRDTPYNTYTRRGLPPTPIALPGESSLKAALNPAEGESLYFVAYGDGSGRHYFSSTLEEHTRAVRKYQIKPRRKN